jgi:ribosomal protein S3
MRFSGKLGSEAVVRAAWVGDGTVFYCTAAAAAELGPVVSRRSPYRSGRT